MIGVDVCGSDRRWWQTAVLVAVWWEADRCGVDALEVMLVVVFVAVW